MVKMQNVGHSTAADNQKLDKVNVKNGVGITLTPNSANSSPIKSEQDTFNQQPRFMSDSSESEDDSASEVESFIIDRTELDDDSALKKSKFLLSPEEGDRTVDPETQARFEALLHAAGNDPEVLRRLTSSVSCALDEAAAALTRMRTDNPRANHSDKTSLVEACTDGDVGTVRKLLTEGRSVHETTEEGESLLSLACSAGYFELAQVLLAMHANVEDRGIKGECTPLMEAASAGHLDIVRLLIAHGADVNAQSTSGNTPLMYACAGGHEEAVEILLVAGANVEDHNENGHTPLMEAASAGHVNVAKILLRHGAGINTHSNEFKESALTLACYKGHLDMVRFLLEAGADQEHKTDEMHTALMEASMDGHVEVARLLLDSGAQVNMPTDSFESPLTLAACGGHVDLAMLLIERGANIEEVNDEGYTPLMEAAREGHEEMVALLLSQGANINAQTDETQETALTLACCGGFSEVADFLIKAGADIELGASTPLMEAAQEGHLELVRYLLQAGANVHAQTQTGDTALTYACENGHTDVADLLLEYNADLEHESEGGRTPLMKACRAGHLCTVQFLISKGANVNRQTTNNDHTPLSLACAGGHLSVVELLLSHSADPFHKLKDNSTMLIEAAKGGHTNVVQLLLDYPHSIMMASSHPQQAGNVVGSMLQSNLQSMAATGLVPVSSQNLVQNHQGVPTTTTAESLSCAGLHEVPEAVRIVSQEENDKVTSTNAAKIMEQFMQQQPKTTNQKSLLRKNRSSNMMFDGSLTSAEAQQVRSQPLGDLNNDLTLSAAAIELLSKDDSSILDKGSTGTGSIVEYIKARSKNKFSNNEESLQKNDEHILEKQQILEEIHKVERELQVKTTNHMLVNTYGINQESSSSTNISSIPPVSLSASSLIPGVLNLDLASHTLAVSQGLVCGGMPMGALFGQAQTCPSSIQNAFYTGNKQSSNSSCIGSDTGSSSSSNAVSVATPFSPTAAFAAATDTGTTCRTAAVPAQPTQNQQQNQQQQTLTNWTQQQTTQTIATSPAEVSQSTAISDRPKAKPVSKKEGKNLRKQLAYQAALQQHQQHLQQINQQLKQQVLQQQAQLDQLDQAQELLQTTRPDQSGVVLATPIMTHILEPSLKNQRNTVLQSGETTDLVGLLSDQENCQLFSTDSIDNGNKLIESVDTLDSQSVDDVQTLETFSLDDVTSVAAQVNEVNNDKLQLGNTQVINNNNSLQQCAGNNAFPTNLDHAINAITAAHSPMQVGQTQTDVNIRNYQDLQAQHTGLQFQYEQYLQSVAGTDQVHTTNVPSHLPTDVGAMYQAGFQAGIQLCQEMHMSKTSHISCAGSASPESPQIPITTTPSQVITVNNVNNQQQPNQFNQQQPTCTTHQVQVATQTQNITQSNETKNISPSDIIKVKKGRLLMQRQQPNHVASIQNGQFSNNQNFQIDPTANPNYNYQNSLPQTSFSCMDVDSETDSNHDTALTLACAGGHEDLVELLLSRGADIEHRDKKGFTPLILAATAGHEKVVEILLNHGADIEAQSERTKDTPLSLACSGGRYEVVELLLSRNANREHRNVSDYTPLSLAASGGYVNIIKLLLNHGAEINSRTGSKLGISPLMLAAMNGHTAAVKLLLDMGSDINAQIETNRNTALTLACFQGRHEVVSLLLDRRANVEHRAKTGLTPLMEAASGGYVEVGRVLLDKGADVNATPVPSSRDTALTIAADKGHCRFVELLLCRGAAVEVKNKKGNSPLWLAANGGHLSVVELLYNSGADIDSQDNRKVSCLMAAFRKGHTKVVKWMVNHVTQFPSDQEMIRFIQTISDKELLEKCQECIKIIRAAKETQAAKANKNATILLEELDKEKTREESKKAAAARRRERKKKKKLEKKEEKRKLYEENKKNENYDDKEGSKKNSESEKGQEDFEEASGDNAESPMREPQEEGDSGIDANSQGSCSSNDMKSKEKRKDKKKKKSTPKTPEEDLHPPSKSSSSKELKEPKETTPSKNESSPEVQSPHKLLLNRPNNRKGILVFESSRHQHPQQQTQHQEDFAETETYPKNKNQNKYHQDDNQTPPKNNTTSPKGTSKREEGWKEVVRKSSVQTVQESGSKKVSVPLNAISRVIGRGGSNINAIRGATGAHIEVEKQSKGQGERNITIKGSPEAIKQAHMLIAALIKDPDVDIFSMLPRTTKTVTSSLWDKTNAALMAKKTVKTTQAAVTSFVVSSSTGAIKNNTVTVSNRLVSKVVTTFSASVTRSTAPRLVAATEKRVSAIGAQTKNTMSYTSAIMTAGRGAPKVVSTTPQQTFAAKLTETTAPSVVPTSQAMVINKTRTSHQNLVIPLISSAPTSPSSNSQAMTTCTTISSPKHSRPQPTASAPPSIHNYQIPGKAPFSNPSNTSAPIQTSVESGNTPNQILSTPISVQNIPNSVGTPFPENQAPIPSSTTQEYSLFNDSFTKVAQQSMWGRENEKPNFAAATGAGINAQNVPMTPQKLIEPPIVDASKAPGYRGNQTCSPVSSKTSSNSTTPPSIPLAPGMNYQNFEKQVPVPQPLSGIGPISRPLSRPGGLELHNANSSTNSLDLATNHFVNRHIYSSSEIIRPLGEPIYKSSSSGNFQENSNLLKMVPDGQNMIFNNSLHHMTYSQPCQNTNTTVSMSRLNPRAPDFSLIKAPQVPIYNNFNQVYPGPNQGSNSNIPFPLKSSMGNFQSSNTRTNPNRWPYMAPSNFQNQNNPDMLVQMPIRNLNHPPGPMDLLENGMCPNPNVINTPPNMSPNSIPNLGNQINTVVELAKLDESRKIPQPIGTERNSWKIQNSNLPNTDITDVNWILGNESKIAMGGWNGPLNIVDQQRQQQQFYRTTFRMQPDDGLPHMIDGYPHGGTQLDNQHGFQNGAVPPMSLVAPPTLLQQQYPGGLVAQDLIQQDPMKMEMPNWDANPRLNAVSDMQDKQHNWKWN